MAKGYEGASVHRECARQFFGLLLIPTLVFGVHSTPRKGGWVGGMGRFGIISPHGLALFGLGIWASPFPHLLSPSLPSLMRFRATGCMYVYHKTSCVHADTFSMSILEH